jgi:hypothetical protein
MHSYRVASAVHAQGDILAVRNASGMLELFTTGTDGTVWNFYPDPGSDTGYRAVQVPLHAALERPDEHKWMGPSLAAGVDEHGRIVLFSFVPPYTVLWSAHETGQPDARWSTAVNAYARGFPSSECGMYAVFAENIAGHLFVGVASRVPNPDHVKGDYAPFCSDLAWSDWQTDAHSFTEVTFPTILAGSATWSWAGNTRESAAAVCAFDGDDHTVREFTSSWLVTQQQQDMLIPVETGSYRPIISMDAAVDGEGNSQIFGVRAVGNAANLARLALPESGWRWLPLSTGFVFRQVEAEVDGEGDIQLFAVSQDDRLYHLRPNAFSPTGYTEPAPIFAGVAKIAVGRNDKGNVDVFAVGRTDGTLTHLFLQADEWQHQTLEVPTGGEIEEYISYSSDVTVVDANGAPLPNEAVTVWTSNEARLTVNANTYVTDPAHPVQVTTNSAGLLTLTQETDSLGVPTLQLKVPRLTRTQTLPPIEQYAGIRTTLREVTDTGLKDARDASGNWLLADKYRQSEETLKGLAAAFNQCMELPVQKADGNAPPGPAPVSGVGGPILDAVDASDLLPGSRRAPHWSLSFEADGRVVYRELSTAAANELLAQARATAGTAGDFWDWIGSLYDFVVGVAEGFYGIIECVVTTVADGLQAIFKFVADGVKRVFKVVVRLIQQAFELIEAIFAAVGINFSKIFEWLGELLDWNGILRTHDALTYTVDQLLRFVELAVPHIKTKVDAVYADLDRRLSDGFDDAINKVAGGATLGGYEQANRQQEPKLSYAVANNVVYNALINNFHNATLTLSMSGSMSAELEGRVDTLMQQFHGLSDATTKRPEYTELKSLFDLTAKSPEQILATLLKDVLLAVEKLCKVVLDGTKEIVTTLLDAFASLVASLRTLLIEDTWDIPLLSPLYGWITRHDGRPDEPLTLLGVATMIVAIPTAIIYRLSHDGASPFPDAASLDAFKRSFSAQSMLQASGLANLATEAGVATDRAVSEVSPDTAQFVGLAAAGSTFAFGLFSGLLDSLPPTGGIPTPSDLFLPGLTVAYEIGGWALSAPWFTATGVDWSQSQWFYQIAGWCSDACFLAAARKLPENFEDWSIGLEEVYAVFNGVFGLVSSLLPKTAGGLDFAANLLPVVPELLKFLRLSEFVIASEGASLVVLGFIDGVFYTATAGIQGWLVFHPQGLVAEPTMA